MVESEMFISCLPSLNDTIEKGIYKHTLSFHGCAHVQSPTLSRTFSETTEWEYNNKKENIFV